MATREGRKGNSFGWFLIGILVGAVLLAGAYFYFSSDRSEPPVVPEAEAVEPLAPEPGAAPVAPPIAPPPVAVVPPAPAPLAPISPDEERQLADDAAAAGMTGAVNPPMDQPTN